MKRNGIRNYIEGVIVSLWRAETAPFGADAPLALMRPFAALRVPLEGASIRTGIDYRERYNITEKESNRQLNNRGD